MSRPEPALLPSVQLARIGSDQSAWEFTSAESLQALTHPGEGVQGKCYLAEGSLFRSSQVTPDAVGRPNQVLRCLWCVEQSWKC